MQKNQGIVLIDGIKLTELMMQYSVGIEEAKVYKQFRIITTILKRILEGILKIIIIPQQHAISACCFFCLQGKYLMLDKGNVSLYTVCIKSFEKGEVNEI